MATFYHAKYWAHALTLRGETGSIESLTRSIAGSRVDLNPHQVDAALFAIRSPLTRGAILADEVGLGKTIEAGMVIAQRWAERKRRILVIVPATLRTQWQQELESKFYLPTRVLDSRAFNDLVDERGANPFDSPDRLIICSYHFASAKGTEVHRVPWDLVVLDEEVVKLDGWSDDLKQGLERELKELDRQIREFRKTSALAAALKDKLEAQKGLRLLESERNRKRRELFDAQDAIDVQRDVLIGRIEKQLCQRHTLDPLFAFRWRLE